MHCVCCKQPHVNMIDYFQAQRHLVLTLAAVFPKLKENIASVLIGSVCPPGEIKLQLMSVCLQHAHMHARGNRHKQAPFYEQASCVTGRWL